MNSDKIVKAIFENSKVEFYSEGVDKLDITLNTGKILRIFCRWEEAIQEYEIMQYKILD